MTDPHATEIVDTWTARLAQAHADGTRIDAPDPLPGSIEDAYRIQTGVARTLGPIGGFKTGRIGGQPLDMPPIMAPIYRSGVLDSGASCPVTDLLGIELEVGLRIIADIPLDLLADLATASPATWAALVEPVAVIELVDCRVNGPAAADPIVKLADNQINAGLVVGQTADRWDGTDFTTFPARLTAGTHHILGGATKVPGGSALRAFAGLAGIIGTHCGGLQVGQIVITGALHPLVYYPPGTEVAGQIDGIGAVRVSLD